ncbi:MAG: hypothetical protein PWQ57_3167 [Desulfovibrionales bacterium]|nr:hypothetical protein [Desulfovibrionales bacterium]
MAEERKTHRRVWRLLVAALALTGFAQMPIFKRYYVADVPGFGWLANFTLNHSLHLALGAAFLAIVAYLAVQGIARRSAWTIAGLSRAAVVGALAASGLLRAVMDLPGTVYPQTAFIAMDLVHLGATMAWGALELALWAAKVRARRRGLVGDGVRTPKAF